MGNAIGLLNIYIYICPKGGQTGKISMSFNRILLLVVFQSKPRWKVRFSRRATVGVIATPLQKALPLMPKRYNLERGQRWGNKTRDLHEFTWNSQKKIVVSPWFQGLTSCMWNIHQHTPSSHWSRRSKELGPGLERWRNVAEAAAAPADALRDWVIWVF